MTLTALALVGLVAMVTLAWLYILKGRRGDWFVDYVSVGLMLGFIAVAILSLAQSFNYNTGVALAWYYAPHAYNLVIWPIFGLIILRPRFGPKMFLLSFIFVYSLDEIMWNFLAFVSLKGNPAPLGYIFTQYWQVFFLAILVAFATSYYLVRPRIVPNAFWLVFSAYVVVYGFLEGLPTYLDEPPSLYGYAFAWELAWQFAMWALIYTTFKARAH